MYGYACSLKHMRSFLIEMVGKMEEELRLPQRHWGRQKRPVMAGVERRNPRRVDPEETTDTLYQNPTAG